MVTVPDRDSPLTVPVPPTEVTVPAPAPIAVLNEDASNAYTVLSALTLKNVIADGFVRVNRLAPAVVAPKLVLAPAAVVDPVPPFATATVPVTLAAVPSILVIPVNAKLAGALLIATAVVPICIVCAEVAKPTEDIKAAGDKNLRYPSCEQYTLVSVPVAVPEVVFIQPKLT